MGVAYYIVLDNEDPEFDTFVNGKSIARDMDVLDSLCESNGIAKLESFIGQSADDYSDLLGEEIEFPPDVPDGNTWFEPADGIALIEALKKIVQENQSQLDSPEDVLDDLNDYLNVLTQAKEIGAKWHLALDI